MKAFYSVLFWLHANSQIINSGLLVFRAVAEPRISSKSAKSREIHKTCKIPRNSLKVVPNTCRYNIFETSPDCWSCLLAVNLQIYGETLSLERVNNIQKLPGRFHEGVLGIGGLVVSLFRRCITFCKECKLYSR